MVFYQKIFFEKGVFKIDTTYLFHETVDQDKFDNL